MLIVRDGIRKAERAFVVDAFKKQLEVEEYVVLAVWHLLYNPDVVPLEEVSLEFKPIIFLTFSHYFIPPLL